MQTMGLSMLCKKKLHCISYKSSQALLVKLNLNCKIKVYTCALTANVPRDSNSPNEKSPKTSLMLIFDLNGGKNI